VYTRVYKRIGAQNHEKHVMFNNNNKLRMKKA